MCQDLRENNRHWTSAEITASNLPRHDDHKIHDVPHVSQVTAWVQDKALSQDFQAGFYCEYPQEVGFCGLLKFEKEKFSNQTK